MASAPENQHETSENPDSTAFSSVVSTFPELANLGAMDDEQQLQTFTSVLDQLHRRLDEVTGR